MRSENEGSLEIAGSSVRVCPIPLPPPCELRELVNETTALLEDVSVQEAVLVEAADQLASLRQSILYAAFTGRFVPQDPADEPAVALLARLRTDPAAHRRTRKQARAA